MSHVCIYVLYTYIYITIYIYIYYLHLYLYLYIAYTRACAIAASIARQKVHMLHDHANKQAGKACSDSQVMLKSLSACIEADAGTDLLLHHLALFD